MNKYLEQLNKLTNNKYNYIRVYSVDVFVKDSLIDITLLVPQHIYDFELSDEDKKTILHKSKEIIPYPFKHRIIYRKSYADTSFILRDILDYINAKFPALITAVRENDIDIIIDEEIIKIHITLEHSAHSYFKNSGAEERILKYLSNRYCNKIVIEYTINEDKAIETQEEVVQVVTQSHFVKIDNQLKILGKEISTMPKLIRDIKQDYDKIACCGRIKNMNKYNKRDSTDVYYVFNIDDTTGSVKALYFPKIWQNKNNDNKAQERALNEYNTKIKIMDKLLSDSAMGNYNIIAQGNIKQDNNNGEWVMFINSLASCRIDFASIESKVIKKKVPDNYSVITPRPFIDTLKRANTVVPNYLRDKRFVVFDFETTGIDPKVDTPIELGAVSIENGEIVQEFSTFINPRRTITPEITKLTNITNLDVANAPYIEDIIPDFYKFCKGAILVAHNAEFDYSFLKKAAHPDGYIFDNDRQDTLALSREYLKELARYNLETVASHIGIVNEGAHRAIYDAITTARLYLYLIERI